MSRPFDRRERTSEGDDAPAEPPRALVVEDNPVNAYMAMKMLERLGHRVRTVGNGGQAVDALANEDFDVVLMDVQMPEVDGLEATRLIRQAEGETGRHVYVLGVTTIGEKGEADRCLAAGMDEVLAKPFTLEMLAATLKVGQGGSHPAGEEGPDSATPGIRPVLDRVRLAMQLGGDQEAVKEVLRDFLTEGPATLERLQEASAAGDARGVEGAAHRLKGALRWITADVAAAVAETVERQAGPGPVDLPPRLLNDLVREVSRALEEARR